MNCHGGRGREEELVVSNRPEGTEGRKVRGKRTKSETYSESVVRISS